MLAPNLHQIFVAAALSTCLGSAVARAAGPALLDGGTVGASQVVRMEAESVFAAPFVEIDGGIVAGSASGGSFIAVAEGSGGQPGQPGGGSDYGIGLVAGGDVAVWARVWTPDAGSDGFWYRFDGAGSWSSWEAGVLAGWSWRRVTIAGLEAGGHTFSLAHREDGVRVDALLFSSDLNLVPGNGLGFLGDTGNARHHVEIADPILATQALTIEAWVKLDETPAGSWDPIVAKGGEWGLLRYQNTDKLVFRTGGDDLVSLNALVPGRWTHVAASLGGGTKRIYFDGVLNRTKTEVGGVAPGPARLRFGANVDNPNAVYRGGLDEVRVWSVERSAAEIFVNRDLVLSGGEPGLEGYWRFETTGLTALDSSAAGRDGVLQGFSGGAPLRVDGIRLTGASKGVGFARLGTPRGRVLDAVVSDGSTGQLKLVSLPGGTIQSDIGAGGFSSRWVGTGDIDNDGDLDVVVLNQGDTNRLYMNNGSGVPFQGVVGQEIASDLWSPVTGKLGDMNGDGLVDLVVAQDSKLASIYLNNGTTEPFAGVSGVVVGAGGEWAIDMDIGDVDGDGHLDILRDQYFGGGWSLYLNNGTADPFAGVVETEVFADRNDDVGSVTLGDVDGDGDLDAIAGVWYPNSARPIGLYLNNGTATPFAGVTALAVTQESYSSIPSPILGDFDGDGDLDVVVASDERDDLLYLNNGTADPFAGVSGTIVSGGNANGGSAGDFDGDGDVDLILTGGSRMDVFLNNGTAAPFSGVTPIASEVTGVRGEGYVGAMIVTADIVAGELTAGGAPPGINETPEAHLVGAAAVESALRFGEEFTFETWVRYDVAPEAPVVLVEKGASWGVYLDPVGKVVFSTGRSPGGVDVLKSETVLAAGEWVHVAVVSSGAGSGLARKAIYLGGALDVEKDDVVGAAVQGSEAVLFGGDGTESLIGAMDEIRAWNRALGSETIAAQHGRNLSGLEPGLVLLWRLDVEEPSVRNSALNGAGSGAITAAFESGMSEANYEAGVSLGEALAPQFDLFFDGTEYVQVAHDASLNFAPALTVEAWVRPTSRRPSTVLVKGAAGYGLGLDVNLRPVFFEGSDLLHTVSANATLPLGEWSHVAVVVEEAPGGGPNGRTTFYINGRVAGVHAQGLIVNNSEPLFIGKAGVVMPQGFVGEIDEVRLWGSAVTSGQIGLLAQVPLPDGGAGIPGLSAYWGFDEGTGSVTTDLTGAGRVGSLIGMDETNWRFGHDFGVPPIPGGLNLTAWPGSAGLWIGQVLLDQVSEVKTSSLGSPGPLAGTGDRAGVRVILHVDGAGRVRLLKDVIVMQRRDDPDDPGSPVSVVLVTEPELIPNFEGVVKRGGKVVGLRYGSASYDFEGAELSLLGGIGPSLGCAGNIVLGANHATNPYRHKFHPRHGSGFAITRSIGMHFDGEPSDPLSAAPGFGVDRITGVYNETVTGLHKIPIRVRGRVELNRISDVGVLNE